MSSSYFLSTDSYVCLDHRYCIFLDARSDKYLVTARKTIDCLAPWLSGWRSEFSSSATDTPIPAHVETVAEDFVRLGILTKSSHLGKPLLAQYIQRPTETLQTAREFPSRWRTLWHFHASIRSSFWARERLSRHSLISTVQLILSRRTAHNHPAPELNMQRMEFLVNAFNHWHNFFSTPNACLYDSLSLLDFLAQFDMYPSLVFGVTPDPFQAHCWLQHGSVLLNDSLSRVADYTPLMIV